MVADVVAAPEDDVAADPYERLHGVVLEDEAVLAELDVAPHEGATRHVARECVALLLRGTHQPRAKPVHLRVDERGVDRRRLWVELLLEGLERHDREAAKLIPLEVV